MENQYLTISQAVEGYHRIKYGSKYVDSKTYNKYQNQIKKQINDIIPDVDLRNKLHASIKYGNEYSLRKRLFHLVSPLTHYCTAFFPKNLKDHIHKAVEYRNRFTHPNASKKSAFSPDKVTFDYIRLQALMDTLMLMEIGIKEETAVNIVRSRYDNFLGIGV